VIVERILHTFRRWAGCGLCLLLAGCSAWPTSWGTPCCVDAKPTVRRQPIGWHLVDVSSLGQLEQAVFLRRLLPVRAQNLRAGVVADSAFFTDRDPAGFSAQDVRWGPSRPDDFAQPPFTITKAKSEGKTAGFFVTDARGVRYLFKLDPVDAPELLTGAEVVTSKLLAALGYHVPSYEIAEVRPVEFQLQPGVVLKDAEGRRRDMTQQDVDTLLRPRMRAGAVRVVQSRILDGDILGPARFKRFRDCADVRALKLAYAWTNNIDAKDHNTLLVWNGTKTVGYLFDFGTSLGADAGRGGPQHPCAGWTYMVDVRVWLLEAMTLGLYDSDCDVNEPVFSTAVGRFSPRVNPRKWKAYAPNLAFEEMTQDDARWMAQRLAALRHEHLEAAVSAGQYSDAADAAYLVQTLEARRRLIVQAYASKEGER